MAVAQVQKVANNNFGTSVTATLATAPTAGNLLIGLWQCQGAGPPTATAPSGWTVPTGGNYLNTGTGGGRIVAMYKVAGAGEATAITMTTSASVNQDLAVFEYSGADTTAPFDVIGSADLGSSGSTTHTTATISTAGAGVVLVAMAQAYNATTWSNTWTNSFVQQTKRDGFFETAQRITSGAVSGLNSTETWAGTAQAYSLIVAFKAAGAGPDTTAPTFSWAVNGSTLTGTASEALDTTQVPATSAFTPKVNGVARGVTNVAVANTGAGGVGLVTLTLASAVVSTDTVTLSYSP